MEAEAEAEAEAETKCHSLAMVCSSFPGYFLHKRFFSQGIRLIFNSFSFPDPFSAPKPFLRNNNKS